MTKPISVTISSLIVTLLLVGAIALDLTGCWNVLGFFYGGSLMAASLVLMRIKAKKMDEDLVVRGMKTIHYMAWVNISSGLDVVFAAVAAYTGHFFMAAVIFMSGAVDKAVAVEFKRVLPRQEPFGKEE